MEFRAFQRYVELVPLPAGAQPRIQREVQNSDYESGVVLIGSERWRLRTARITPTKPGAFVAVWQRNSDGVTQPFGADDSTSGLLVFVSEAERFGVFRFTTSHLISLGVSQSELHPGKRGFRVYPNWCSDLNRQASRTQDAQSSAFCELH